LTYGSRPRDLWTQSPGKMVLRFLCSRCPLVLFRVQLPTRPLRPSRLPVQRACQGYGVPVSAAPKCDVPCQWPLSAVPLQTREVRSFTSARGPLKAISEIDWHFSSRTWSLLPVPPLRRRLVVGVPVCGCVDFAVLASVHSFSENASAAVSPVVADLPARCMECRNRFSASGQNIRRGCAALCHGRCAASGLAVHQPEPQKREDLSGPLRPAKHLFQPQSGPTQFRDYPELAKM